MSYDLLVFEPTAAPRDRGHFMRWWDEQSKWGEAHGYNDLSVCPPALRGWYRAITTTFPDVNGCDVSDDDVGSRHADYSLGRSLIYAAFAWTEAEAAYPLVRGLAVEHSVGFYDASGDEGDGEIYFPGDQLRPPSTGRWRKVAADFRSGNVSKYVPQDFPQEEPSKRRWFDLFRRSK